MGKDWRYSALPITYYDGLVVLHTSCDKKATALTPFLWQYAALAYKELGAIHQEIV
jgi:hypothetical protein